MSALATSIVSDAGHVAAVSNAGATVSLVDARLPGRVSDERIALLESKAGPALAAVREQAELFAAPFRAELAALAGGGDLPSSVAALAHLAVEAMADHRIASLVARGSAGRWAAKAARADFSETVLEEDAAALERAEQHALAGLRVAAGLAIAARDLLRAAREAAKEAGADALKSQGGAVGGLMTRLGVGRSTPSQFLPTEQRPMAGVSGSAPTQVSPPFSTPGGVLSGPPSLNSPPSPEKP